MAPSDYQLTDLNSPFPGAPIWSRKTTGSTMDDARALGNDVRNGTVLWADRQLRGRGRGEGRVWHAEAGENLLVTLVVTAEAAIPPGEPGRIASIPLRVGLGVADSAIALGVPTERVRIKWPNDVLVDGRKLCGILCESVSGRFHVGVGLNVNQQSFPIDGPFAPTSLLNICLRRFDRREVLTILLERIQRALRSTDWRQRVSARLYGDRVQLLPAGEGSVSGLGVNGELIVNVSDGSVRSILQPDQISYPEGSEKERSWGSRSDATRRAAGSDE